MTDYTLTYFGRSRNVSAKEFWPVFSTIMVMAVVLLWWVLAGWSLLVGWWGAAFIFLSVTTFKINGKPFGFIPSNFIREVVGAIVVWVGILSYWVPLKDVYVWLWTT